MWCPAPLPVGDAQEDAMVRTPAAPLRAKGPRALGVKDAKGLRCRLNGQRWAPADRLASFQTRSLDNLNELTFRAAPYR